MEITSEKIDLALKKNGMNRNDLAKNLGVSRSAVDTWVTRGRVPKKHKEYISTLFLNKDEFLRSFSSVNGMFAVAIPFTEDEFLIVEEAAKKEGMSIEEYIHWSSLSEGSTQTSKRILTSNEIPNEKSETAGA